MSRNWSRNFFNLFRTARFCFAWSIYRLADGRGWLTATLSGKLLLLLGGASYSIYILQGLIREAAHRLLANIHPGLDSVVAPIILIILSCLIFLFYEEPMREILRKLLVRKQSPKVLTEAGKS